MKVWVVDVASSLYTPEHPFVLIFTFMCCVVIIRALFWYVDSSPDIAVGLTD